MLSPLFRFASIVCTLVLLISFGAFVNDQAQHGSKTTVAKIGDADGTSSSPLNTNVDAAGVDPKTERMREKEHGKVREAIDDVDDDLVAPFTGLASSDSIWVQRGVPTLLALLLFGGGLAFASRYAASRGV